VISVPVSYRRLVERAHEKIRQASRAMPAVMIRQLDGLAKIIEHATTVEEHEVLLEQAVMILRASEESVPEENDRADVQRSYEQVLDVSACVMRELKPEPAR
jgi:uncharacterized membrane protein